MRKRGNGKVFGMLCAMNDNVALVRQLDSNEPAVTCCTCGAVVEADALDAQTMADGSLMWSRPFYREHLLAGLRRLDAALRTPAAGEDGDA